MTAIRRIFRPATRLAAAAIAVLAGLVAAPAAFAMNAPPPGQGDTSIPAAPVVHTVTVGGTPGWQIALFIVAAAVLAAVFAVLLDRTRSGRRQQVATSTQ